MTSLREIAVTVLMLITTVTIETHAMTRRGKFRGRVEDDRVRLMETLFHGYVNDILPRCKEIPEAQIDLSLRAILDVDEPLQLATLNVWIRWEWTDCRLRWNASEFGGVDKLMVSSTRIWIPDITLYDSTGGSDADDLRKQQITIYPSGKVYLQAPIIVRFNCKLDVTYFPYDRQVCRMRYASWSYTGAELDVTNRTMSGDTTVLLENGEWDVIGIPIRRKVLYYPCCTEPFPEVTFYLVIERRNLHYVCNLIIPCIVIVAMATFVFILPSETGEKISMGITVLLSLCVFLLMVSEKMPANSETLPLIGKLFLASILLVALADILTVLALNCHHQGVQGKPVPNWVKVLVLDWLGTLVCLDCTRSKQQKSKGNVQQNGCVDVEYHPVMVPLLDSERLPPSSDDPWERRADWWRHESRNIETLMKKELEILRRLLVILEGHEDKSTLEYEWKRVAIVLDRVFILILTITFVACVACILVQKPVYDKNLQDIDY